MATLHLHDVARIAYGTFSARSEHWGEVQESVREEWRTAVQRRADNEPAELTAVTAGPIGFDLFLDFIEASRPFFEES